MALLTSLVSYWKLDESSGNAADAHGSNTLTNNGSLTYAAAKLNNGANFVAIDDRNLSIADASQSGLDITGNLTISCWIKPATFTNNAVVIMKDSGSVNEGYSLLLLSSGKLQFTVRQTSGGNSSIVLDDTALSTATWYHVICQYNGTDHSCDLYVNNSIRTYTTDTANATSINNNADPLILGSNLTSGGANKYDGLLDEVGIWTKILSSTERAELYGSGTPPSYDNFSEEISVSLSEGLKLADTPASSKQVILSLIEGLKLGEALTPLKQIVATIVEGLKLGDFIAGASTIWTRLTKNSTSFSNQSKNSTSFSNQSKDSTNWTNQDKN